MTVDITAEGKIRYTRLVAHVNWAEQRGCLNWMTINCGYASPKAYQTGTDIRCFTYDSLISLLWLLRETKANPRVAGRDVDGELIKELIIKGVILYKASLSNRSDPVVAIPR